MPVISHWEDISYGYSKYFNTGIIMQVKFYFYLGAVLLSFSFCYIHCSKIIKIKFIFSKYIFVVLFYPKY